VQGVQCTRAHCCGVHTNPVFAILAHGSAQPLLRCCLYSRCSSWVVLFLCSHVASTGVLAWQCCHRTFLESVCPSQVHFLRCMDLLTLPTPDSHRAFPHPAFFFSSTSSDLVCSYLNFVLCVKEPGTGTCRISSRHFGLQCRNRHSGR